MASGSGKPNGNGEDNPFSYHSFVKKTGEPANQYEENELRASDSDDEFDLKDLSAEVARKGGREEAAADNPFSFRKFLSQGNPNPVPSDSPRPSNSMNGGYDAVPDVACSLPDFVQDHIHRDSTRRGSNNEPNRPNSELSLPDFVMGTNDAPSTADSSYSRVFPSINAIGSLIGGREEGPIYSKNPRPSSGNRRVPASFLDAGEVNGDGDGFAADVRVELLNENRRLKEENNALRRQLFESRDMARNESERVTQLLKQVKTLQSREAYETAALEKMVQQVEANLEATTERAVRAESVISKQKQDIKQLKEQLSAHQNSDGMCMDPMDEVRDRTQYISQQLAAAATNAEVSLKQMIGGVQNLKLMSEILASVGRIYDEPSENPKSESAQPDSEKANNDSAKTSPANDAGNVKNMKSDNPKSESKLKTEPDSKLKGDNTTGKKKPMKSQKDGDKTKKS